MASLVNSSFLDFTGYRITNETTPQAAWNMTPAEIGAPQFGINVAIVLDRATDARPLLERPWAERQNELADLEQNGTLWSKYGADQAHYDTVRQDLLDRGFKVLDGSNSATDGDYVSSAASRTLWVSLDTAQGFHDLFGTELFQYTPPSSDDYEFLFWNGELSLPDAWDVKGLWFDTAVGPPASTLDNRSVTLPAGPQSIGNDAPDTQTRSAAAIADLYNFPLQGLGLDTDLIGLIEVGVGSSLPAAGDFQDLLETFTDSVGVTYTGTVTTQGADGQNYNTSGEGLERSLDVGVVAPVNPTSDIRLYVGSGFNGNADSSVYSAIQSAIWDLGHNPAVVSNSYFDDQSPRPDSPFHRALEELYIDAALRNVSLFNCAGDGGSSSQIANGVTNVLFGNMLPWAVAVGGTSISSLHNAHEDPTLNPGTPPLAESQPIYAQALAGDPATLWQLVAGGMTAVPQAGVDQEFFVETAWNEYFLNDSNDITEGGYQQNNTGTGGVDVTQPTPRYQTDYGLSPVTQDPTNRTGRGVPDVSALAGGNTDYAGPSPDMTETDWDYVGTSAATPLWATLATQLNEIFQDQGLRKLGYMNDLLYTASVVAPASFNDVQLGNNTSSFLLGGDVYHSDGTAVTPTGYGYAAGEGYDLVSGLGTPNGLLLARSLTAIAHAQGSPDVVPDVLVNPGDWESGADQSLLVQVLYAGHRVDLTLGSETATFGGRAAGDYAWTGRFAGQALQEDFAPDLVNLFDNQVQGRVLQMQVAAGDDLEVTLGGIEGEALQAALSNSHGFVDFFLDAEGVLTGENLVRVARPLAVAETAGGADDQTAIVRLRQGGEDGYELTFYRVDDLLGTIGGVKPGDEGYNREARRRAYEVEGGGTTIAGPGYGTWGEARLAGVDSGDLVAMMFRDTTTGQRSLSFTRDNDGLVGGRSAGRMWNFGLNTWGFEDFNPAGARDYNDLVVQIDFTSASGTGLIA
jgi:hypothetical protein